MPATGGGEQVILDEAEALWLASCLAGSGAHDGDVADAISTALLDDATEALRQMPEDQRRAMLRDARRPSDSAS